MKCVLHILAEGTRHSAVAVIGGMSVCAQCVKPVAAGLEAGGERTVAGILRDANSGHLP